MNDEKAAEREVIEKYETNKIPEKDPQNEEIILRKEKKIENEDLGKSLDQPPCEKDSLS